MAKIPQNYLHDLIERIDISDIVSRHVDLKKRGDNYLGLCPFHGEKTPSFTVSAKKQFYHCFGCGAHGNAIDFITQIEGTGFVEAVKSLAEIAGLPLPDVENTATYEKHFWVLKRVAKFYQQQLHQHISTINPYLKARGISEQSVGQFGLGFAPNGWQNLFKGGLDSHKQRLLELGLTIQGQKGVYDRFRNRLMFPICDKKNQVLGFGARVLDDSTPKYMNSSESLVFQKSQLLYGLNQLQTKPDYVVLTEGYMDVLMLHQHGCKKAVASLGTAVGTRHIENLRRLSPRLIFCFDADAAGFRAVIRTLKVLLESRWSDVEAYEFLLLPKGSDPDSLVKNKGIGAWEAALESTRSWTDIFISYVTQKNQLIFSTADKLLCLKRAADLIPKNTDPRFVELIIQLLVERLNWQAELVRSHLLNPSGTAENKNSVPSRQQTGQVTLLIDRVGMLLMHEPALISLYNKRLQGFDSSEFRLLDQLAGLINTLSQPKQSAQMVSIEITQHPQLLAWYQKCRHLQHLYFTMNADDLAIEFKNSVEKLIEQQQQKRLQYLQAKMQNTPLEADEQNELNKLIQSLIKAKQNR